MTYKEIIVATLEAHGTLKTVDLSRISGLNRNQCHNNLMSLMKDGLVESRKDKKEVYWTYQGDELKIKQSWSSYTPSQVKHTHPLMTAWF